MDVQKTQGRKVVITWFDTFSELQRQSITWCYSDSAFTVESVIPEFLPWCAHGQIGKGDQLYSIGKVVVYQQPKEFIEQTLARARDPIRNPCGFARRVCMRPGFSSRRPRMTATSTCLPSIALKEEWAKIVSRACLGLIRGSARWTGTSSCVSSSRGGSPRWRICKTWGRYGRCPTTYARRWRPIRRSRVTRPRKAEPCGPLWAAC